MLTFLAPDDAKNAMIAFLINHASDLPDPVRQRLVAAQAAASPVQQICDTADLLYANRDALNDDGRSLVAGLAAYASLNRWFGFDTDGRGNRIAMAMHRDNGDKAPEGAEWPDKADDPAPNPTFAPAP